MTPSPNPVALEKARAIANEMDERDRQNGYLNKHWWRPKLDELLEALAALPAPTAPLDVEGIEPVAYLIENLTAEGKPHSSSLRFREETATERLKVTPLVAASALTALSERLAEVERERDELRADLARANELLAAAIVDYNNALSGKGDAE